MQVVWLKKEIDGTVLFVFNLNTLRDFVCCEDPCLEHQSFSFPSKELLQSFLLFGWSTFYHFPGVLFTSPLSPVAPPLIIPSYFSSPWVVLCHTKGGGSLLPDFYQYKSDIIQCVCVCMFSKIYDFFEMLTNMASGLIFSFQGPSLSLCFSARSQLEFQSQLESKQRNLSFARFSLSPLVQLFPCSQTLYFVTAALAGDRIFPPNF